MKRGVVRGALLACLSLSVSAGASGASRRAPLPRAPPRPFPAPPTVSLVRVVVTRDHLLVVEDVILHRGDWTSGDLDAFVAFGAPGLPRAVDARLYPATDEDDEAPSDLASFEPIPVDRAVRRPDRARLLLGSAAMAGTVLHLREASFRRATAASGAARVRVRTLLDLPAPDVRTGREVVVRLGAHEGEPDALQAIEVASEETRPWVARAEAHLCGPDAAPWPLAVRLQPTVASAWRPGYSGFPLPVAPAFSVRHASDDLCVRFWTTSDANGPR